MENIIVICLKQLQNVEPRGTKAKKKRLKCLTWYYVNTISSLKGSVYTASTQNTPILSSILPTVFQTFDGR